jgi:hypothetical protein
MASTDRANYENNLKDPGETLTPGSTINSQLGHSVVNLSNVHLLKDQVAALEKGLTFCPSPGMPDITNIWNDLEEFFRRLRIKRHFDEILEQEDHNINIFRNKSTWSPPEGQDTTLDLFIKTVKNELLKDETRPKLKSNLTKNQYMGLKQLCDNPHIVMKKADKGSCVVVMNTNDYITEGLRQLNNAEHYQALDNDPTDKFSQDVRSTLDTMLMDELPT